MKGCSECHSLTHINSRGQLIRYSSKSCAAHPFEIIRSLWLMLYWYLADHPGQQIQKLKKKKQIKELLKPKLI